MADHGQYTESDSVRNTHDKSNWQHVSGVAAKLVEKARDAQKEREDG